MTKDFGRAPVWRHVLGPASAASASGAAGGSADRRALEDPTVDGRTEQRFSLGDAAASALAE